MDFFYNTVAVKCLLKTRFYLNLLAGNIPFGHEPGVFVHAFHLQKKQRNNYCHRFCEDLFVLSTLFFLPMNALKVFNCEISIS
jgi:hypothetical protein